MPRPKTILLPTLLATVFTGIAIWLVAGPPKISARPFNAHPFFVSTK
ncbi:hypothetical protein [Bradyrhizobium erythrophlei]|jgi:hypothetical protein|uniref:Uncharacterized protein n=1 Tax=Bradyrhizobium erythrophlei TaxID=1437360 RepID=A0A1M7UE90_9BRAD|nr:hypothetical protein [Bradyrhizobium erythrophlei]SHN81332.1 hypothetical protein SAMN05444170_4690 [Bradyrhizobium erythrophlei]